MRKKLLTRSAVVVMSNSRGGVALWARNSTWWESTDPSIKVDGWEDISGTTRACHLDQTTTLLATNIGRAERALNI